MGTFLPNISRHLAISYCVRLASLLQRVSSCWVLHIELVSMPGRKVVARIWPNDYNIHNCCMPDLTIFKFESTTPNMTQHLATVWPNARSLLCPTMLQHDCIEMLSLVGWCFFSWRLLGLAPKGALVQSYM